MQNLVVEVCFGGALLVGVWIGWRFSPWLDDWFGSPDDER